MADAVDETDLRALIPGVLTAFFHRGADFVTAEDTVQDALVRAWQTWPTQWPDEPKGWLITTAWRRFVAGLLALFLLHHARRPARTRADGSLVPLAEQDRGRWRRDLIAESVTVLHAALNRDRLREYQAQAGLAALGRLDPTLPRYTAAVAYLYEKADELGTAASLYAAAAAQAANLAERDHLTLKAAALRQHCPR